MTHKTLTPNTSDVLYRVMGIIESTYPHDENGKRIEGDSPVSGADVVEMLMELEDDLANVIKGRDNG